MQHGSSTHEIKSSNLKSPARNKVQAGFSSQPALSESLKIFGLPVRRRGIGFQVSSTPKCCARLNACIAERPKA